MEFNQFSVELDELKSLAEEETGRNEADTRGDLVEPLIRVLGYRVKREYEADWGDGKKKVDLAILKDEEPYVVVECKSQSTDLRRDHASQLNGYFTFTSAQVGILTNGVKYEVYLDTNKENVMDDRPFFTFDLIDSDEADRRTIHRLARKPDGSFDLQGFRRDVETMGFKREAKNIFEGWLNGPDDKLGALLNERLVVSLEGSLGGLAQESFVEFVDSKLRDVLQDMDVDRGIGSDITLEGTGERPLSNWSPADGQPVRITFPDGTSARTGFQYEIEVEITRWLMQKGFLTHNSLPIRKGARYLVSNTPEHPSGKAFALSKKVEEGVFVEGAFPLKAHIENAQYIIEYVGQDPAQFKFA